MRKARGPQSGNRWFRRRSYAPPPGETEPVAQQRGLRWYGLPTEPNPAVSRDQPIQPDPQESVGVPMDHEDPYTVGADDLSGGGGDYTRSPFVARRAVSYGEPDVTGYGRAPGDVDSATSTYGALEPDAYEVDHYSPVANPDPGAANMHIVNYSQFPRRDPSQVRLPMFQHSQQWSYWPLSGRSIRFLRAPVGVGGPQRYPEKTPWLWGKSRARSRFYGPAFDETAEETA